MSLQAARDFVNKAKRSESLQKEINERGMSVVDIGRNQGFEFTREEFGEAMREQNLPTSESIKVCWVT